MTDAEIVDPTMNEDEATTIAVGATTEVAETTEVAADNIEVAETTVVAETTEVAGNIEVAETAEVADNIEIAETTEVADNIQDGAATKDETVNSGIKEEETTTMDEIMEEADDAPVAAGSAENAEESTVVPASTSEENVDAPAADVKEDISQEQAGESTETMVDAKEEISQEQTGESTETIADAKEGIPEEQQTGESTETMADATVQPPNETESPAKETKKRVRRVGRTPTRKIAKLEEKIIPSMDVGDNNNSDVAAAVDAATAAIGAIPEAVGAAAMGATSTIDIAPPPANQGVFSKHDEKWRGMFQKLTEFKDRNKHTLVPQCFSEDPRLGRWVHYQRVEFWIFQQKGTAKITEERIARLNNIGFEWDPQKAQWEKMFAKLKEFKKEFSHCRVPKGYDKDWELANWVRNQRLEQANLSKEGKKSRMTPERFKLLDDLGFKWSSPTPARARRNRQVAKKADDSNDDGEEEQKEASGNEPAPMIKPENDVPADPAVLADPAVPADPTAVEEKAVETPVSAQAEEAITAATNLVGNLSAVEESANEQNLGFVQEAIEGKTGAAEEETTKTDDPDLENPVVIV